MTKFKTWLIHKFLPDYCRDDLLEVNDRLMAANAAQKQEIVRLNAYIDGLHAALRRQPRITIYGTEVKKG